MFVLNDAFIKEYHKKGILKISERGNKMLHSTYYYFRLGRQYQIWDSNKGDYQTDVLGEPGKETFELPGKGYARIISLERFYLSSQVFGILGQISDLPALGLRLNFAPFIDPLYDGNLQLGIENLLDRAIDLKYQQPIGKVRFFDISETYPVKPVKGSISESKFKVRGELEDSLDDPWSEYGHESQADWW